MTAADGLQKALVCARAALDKKATDIVVLDVGSLTTIAESLVLCTGRSDRQVQSIAHAIEERLRAERDRPLAIEGLARGQWVLIDCGNVVVHVFQATTRAFYDLERLWQHAPRVELPETLRAPADESGVRRAGA